MNSVRSTNKDCKYQTCKDSEIKMLIWGEYFKIYSKGVVSLPL